MVFFNCNACGESLKKNQVEKHYNFKCRQCEVLSCVDCGKEFWGNDYEQHVKCISEEEKYSGKDFKPKANANKGEVKQEAWTRHVQAAVEKAKTNPQLRSLLIQIVDYTNIPRKKAKYENFLRNSMRVRDSRLITQSWELISAEMNAQKEESQPSVANPTEAAENGQSHPSEDEKKLSKREKKEERQKKNKKKDKKKVADEEATSEAPEKEKKKKKKRKHEESEEEQENEAPAPVENGKKKKKKQRKHTETEDEEKLGTQETQEEDGATEEEHPRVKFDWEAAIEQCLISAKGNELSMKKLNKKVLGEFWARGGDEKIQTEDRALDKFLKTLKKTKRFHVEKNRVCLES